MDIFCPYCDAELEINHDDGFGYEENTAHQMQCSECFKNFVFTTSIIYHYEGFKADCLNGKPHNYKLSHTFPKEFSVMRCENCENERDLTEEERIYFKIGTKEDYIKRLN